MMRRYLVSMALLMPVLAFAHGGEDHGAGAASPLFTEAAPRAEAQTELFEVLVTPSNGQLVIYLDNSATTKPCPQAVEAMTKALTENWGNPSALYGFGIDAARQLRQARHTVAAALGAEPDRVFFTSGGTEADNWAVLGTAKRLGKRGKHIITTAIEHHAEVLTFDRDFARFTGLRYQLLS